MQTLTIIAGVLAVASLLVTVIFVHDRRQRVPGLLLSTGLICLIVSPVLHDSTIEMALIGVSSLLAVASVALSMRMRARPD